MMKFGFQRGGSAGELERGHPPQERPERGLQLDPREGRPKAEVDARAEGEVRVGIAVDPEGVRRGEDRRVAVR